MPMPLPTHLFAELPIWLRGLFLGIALSAPVGPIGILCIRRTLDRGLALGLATGLGAACADTFVASIAAFGLSSIIDFLTAYGRELRLAGALVMLFIAWRIWADHSADRVQLNTVASPETPSAGSLAGVASGGFAITFTNPVTIIATLTLVTTLGVSGEAKAQFDGIMLVVGVLLGAGLWWTALCSFTAAFRHKFSGRTITLINRATAIVLALFSVWILGYALGRLFPKPLFSYL